MDYIVLTPHPLAIEFAVQNIRKAIEGEEVEEVFCELVPIVRQTFLVECALQLQRLFILVGNSNLILAGVAVIHYDIGRISFGVCEKFVLIESIKEITDTILNLILGCNFHSICNLSYQRDGFGIAVYYQLLAGFPCDTFKLTFETRWRVKLNGMRIMDANALDGIHTVRGKYPEVRLIQDVAQQLRHTLTIVQEIAAERTVVLIQLTFFVSQRQLPITDIGILFLLTEVFEYLLQHCKGILYLTTAAMACSLSRTDEIAITIVQVLKVNRPNLCID